MLLCSVCSQRKTGQGAAAPNIRYLGNSHWSLFFPHLSPIRSPSTPAPHLFSSSFLPTTSPRLYHTIPVPSLSLFIFLDKLCQSQLDHYSNKQSSLKSKVFKTSLPSSISSVSGEFVVTDSHANHMHMKKKKRKGRPLGKPPQNPPPLNFPRFFPTLSIPLHLCRPIQTSGGHLF